MVSHAGSEGMTSEEKALASTVPYSHLSPQERQLLLPCVRVQSLDKGETIFREGDPAERFHTIVSGRVKVVKWAPNGRELILTMLGPGDPLGAVAAYEGRAFPASAITLEPSSVLSVGRRDFFRLLESHPEFVRSLLLGFTRRLIELTQKLAQVTAGGVEYRIAAFFLKLADGMGRREEGRTVIPLALSRQDIADMVGTTIETAIRIMSRWGKDGIVRTERACFIIEDRAALERIVEAG